MLTLFTEFNLKFKKTLKYTFYENINDETQGQRPYFKYSNELNKKIEHVLLD